MKALTISQPYATLIASGQKWVENRTWYTPFRGPLAIHAGKGSQYLDRDALSRYPTGCIVAVADMIACARLETIATSAKEIMSAGLTIEQVESHEHTEGPYCWVLRNVRALSEPVPCRGAQGLWDWNENIPEEVAARPAAGQLW